MNTYRVPPLERQIVGDLASVLVDTASIETIAEELEIHIHSPEYWYGKGGDNLLSLNSLTAFQLIAGSSGAFGEWLALDDGTKITECVKYDLHRIFVRTASAVGAFYLIQLGIGESAAQVVQTTIPFQPSATMRSAPTDAHIAQIAMGQKLWGRAACTTDAGTIDIHFGLHKYF